MNFILSILNSRDLGANFSFLLANNPFLRVNDICKIK